MLRLWPWAEALVTIVFIFLVIAALLVLIHVAKLVFFLFMGTVVLVCLFGFTFANVLSSIKEERSKYVYKD